MHCVRVQDITIVTYVLSFGNYKFKAETYRTSNTFTKIAVTKSQINTERDDSF